MVLSQSQYLAAGSRIGNFVIRIKSSKDKTSNFGMTLYSWDKQSCVLVTRGAVELSERVGRVGNITLSSTCKASHFNNC
jgi:hypothetical protein